MTDEAVRRGGNILAIVAYTGCLIFVLCILGARLFDACDHLPQALQNACYGK